MLPERSVATSQSSYLKEGATKQPNHITTSIQLPLRTITQPPNHQYSATRTQLSVISYQNLSNSTLLTTIMHSTT